MAWTNVFQRESLMIDFFNPPLWMDRNTKSVIIKKRKSWKSYKYSKSVLAHAKYVKDRNECTNAVRSAKMSFERKIASKVKSFWNYINSKLKTRSGIDTLERSDGTLASSEADKVEVLNKFFASVFTTGTCFIQNIYAPSSSLPQGKHLPFSPSSLRLTIFRLFVILSLTQLYRYTPEIFLFSAATFKYTYRAPLGRIGQEYSANVAFSIFQSLKRIQPLTVRSKLI
jgi:hypothetical protein